MIKITGCGSIKFLYILMLLTFPGTLCMGILFNLHSNVGFCDERGFQTHY